MRGKPGTIAELAALAEAAKFCAEQGLPFAKHLGTLHQKLVTPQVQEIAHMTSIAKLEAALVATSGGKVVPVQGGPKGFWIALQRAFASHGATETDARTVGSWISAQSWLTGVRTIDQVLKSWPSYLTRARVAGTAVKESHDQWSRPEL